MSNVAKLFTTIGEHLEGPSLPLDIAETIFKNHAERYHEPWRHYHNIEHLSEMATFLVANLADLQSPRRVFWAMTGHDTMQVPHLFLPGVPTGVNEELSAQFTESSLFFNVKPAERKQIGNDIRATADHRWGGVDTDLAYLLDADLGILGSSPERFDRYDGEIAKEFKGVVDPIAFRIARLGVLRTFLGTERIYKTDSGHELFEAQAKENLERKVEEYGALLAAS